MIFLFSFFIKWKKYQKESNINLIMTNNKSYFYLFIFFLFIFHVVNLKIFSVAKTQENIQNKKLNNKLLKKEINFTLYPLFNEKIFKINETMGKVSEFDNVSFFRIEKISFNNNKQEAILHFYGFKMVGNLENTFFIPTKQKLNKIKNIFKQLNKFKLIRSDFYNKKYQYFDFSICKKNKIWKIKLSLNVFWFDTYPNILYLDKINKVIIH